jgi:internalin A
MTAISQLLEVISGGKLFELNLAEFNKTIDTHNLSKFGIKDFEALTNILMENLDELYSVRSVDLTGNYLDALPEFVPKLRNLRRLVLYRNKLGNLPTELGNLKNLTVLNMGETSLIQFPMVICDLLNLEELYLYRNHLTSLPREICNLKKLTTLVAYYNEIEEIPEEITSLKNLQNFVIHTNPIKNIPEEIYTAGIAAIRTYFNSLSKESSLFLREAKLIIVGNGGTGKTSIVRNLRDSNYGTIKHESTHGLDVSTWHLVDIVTGESFKFNIWDFGGQGKYRDVQQFFCTPNALYIYITEPDTGVKNQNDKYIDSYWLSLIHTLGFDQGSDKRSPVIYVMNKTDLNHKKRINEADKVEEFDNIVEFVRISCRDENGVNEIRNAIIKNLSKINVFNQKFNTNWLEVKKILEKLRGEKQLITIDEYKEICRQNFLEGDESELLLRYLNANGAVLYFPNVRSLKYKIILNPEWVKNAVYNVLDYSPILDGTGKFTEEDFTSIWKEYEDEDYYKLLDLMKEFEMCYEINENGQKVFVIPSLFSNTPPEEYLRTRSTFSLGYECEFIPFLPAGIFIKLIVRHNELLSKQGEYWSSGAVFRYREDTLAEVVEHWRENKLVVWLKGRDRFELLTLISNEVNSIIERLKIEKSMGHLRIQEYVLYNQKKITPIEGKTLYELLREIESEGKSIKSGVVIEQLNISGGYQQIADNIQIIKNSSDNKRNDL